MALDTNAKIKIGLGVFVIGLTALTLNFFLKNVRKLVHLEFDYKDTDVNKINLKIGNLYTNMIDKNIVNYSYKKPNRDILTISYWVCKINEKINLLKDIPSVEVDDQRVRTAAIEQHV
jgi:hypothetical protein